MTIRDEIISLISEKKLGSAQVTEDSNLYTDLGLESLAFVQLLLKIEGIYSITFDLLEMETCLQVDRLIALVENKVMESGHDQALINDSGESE